MLFTAYSIVRTVPSANGQTGGKKKRHGGTGKVGEPLRDLGTRLEEGSMGQPVG